MLLRAGGASDKKHVCLVTLAAVFNVPATVDIGPTAATMTVPINTVQKDTDNIFDAVNNRIVLPSWAKWVRVSGKLSYPIDGSAGAVPGEIGVHLFRNNTSTPEAHYHDRRQIVPAAGGATGQFSSVLGGTNNFIPVMALNEAWTLVAYQNYDPAGVNLFNLGVNLTDNWLSVEFAK